MYCVNCSTKLPAGAKFCAECGTAAPEQVSRKERPGIKVDQHVETNEGQVVGLNAGKGALQGGLTADIKQEDETARAFSIYRPNTEDGGETMNYAKQMLGGESTLINWADDNQRKRFLNESQRVATSL